MTKRYLRGDTVTFLAEVIEYNLRQHGGLDPQAGRKERIAYTGVVVDEEPNGVLIVAVNEKNGMPYRIMPGELM